MRNQIAVIGLGIFGSEIATSLASKKFSVLAIDSNPDVIEAIKDRVTTTMILDSTQKKSLVDANLNEFETVVVAIGNDHLEDSILTTALLKELGVSHIIARATDDLHERILRQVGANEIVNPEREIGEKVAARIAHPGFTSVFDLVDGICVAEILIPQGFIGKNLEQLAIRRRYDLNVLGVQRLRKDGDGSPATRKMLINMSPSSFVFEENDILLVMGRQEGIDRITQEH